MPMTGGNPVDHTPSTTGTSPPAAVVAWLDGTALEDKVGSAAGLTTTDAEGWPRTALLTPGELLLLPSGELRATLHEGSSTTRNLRRDGRLVLTVAADGALYELRFEVREVASLTDLPLAMFVGPLLETREHRASYADVVGGIQYALHDPAAVLVRWRRQVEVLRALAG
jgi:hypothetical protein